MSLKTKLDLQTVMHEYATSESMVIFQSLTNITVRHNILVPHVFRHTVSLEIFSMNSYTISGPLYFSLYNLDKYARHSDGKTQNDIEYDFYYHWLTDFSELSTLDQIKARLQDKTTCTTIATIVALNKWIKNNSLSLVDMKKITKGSGYRWEYLNDNYIPSTFYKGSWDDISIIVDNSSLFPNYTFANLISFTDYITDERLTILQNIEETLEQERTRPRELQSYNARATDRFEFKFKKETKITKLPLFLGVELELDNFTTSEYLSLDTLKDHAIFKRDGSVSNGVEICTAPATLDIQQQEFDSFFTAMKINNSKLKVTTSCGLHVHIDRKSLSSLHIANIYQFVNKTENREFITQIAGRPENTYCASHQTTYGHFTQEQEKNKYRQVNLRPKDTIEFRMFASTIDPIKFKARLEFTQAVVDYTRPGETSLSLSQISNWSNFIQYTSNHKKFYPHLIGELQNVI